MNIRKIGRGIVLPDKKIKKLIEEFILNNFNSPNKILDFGSGTLFWSEWFAKTFNCSTIAYDPLYEKNPIDNKDKRIETAWKFNIDKSFDGVFVCDVLHHLNKNDLEETLSKMASNAKWIIIKDIEAADFLGNLQNKIHDLIINRTKTIDIYSDKLEDFLIKNGFETQKSYMKKLGYPHFLLLAKKIEN